ncbi:MAG: hypothetical protein AAGC70_07620 [Pseudomonadota bacterium]
MSLDRLALIIILIPAAVWIVVMLAGVIAAWPYGIPVLIAFAVVAYIFMRIVAQRLSSREDDYYEKNIHE